MFMNAKFYNPLFLVVGSILFVLYLSGCGGGGGGSRLPPDPGEAGKETVAGIDSDDDGVRDDIQRYIQLNHTDQNMKKNLTEWAKIKQDSLLNTSNKSKALEDSTKITEYIDCLYVLDGENATRVFDDFYYAYINTIERYKAQDIVDIYTSGEPVTRLSKSELQDKCYQ